VSVHLSDDFDELALDLKRRGVGERASTTSTTTLVLRVSRQSDACLLERTREVHRLGPDWAVKGHVILGVCKQF